MNEKKVFERIEEVAEFMIGSREWGGHKKDSDYDFVFKYNVAEKIIHYLQSKNVFIEKSYYPDHILKNQANYKFTLDGKIVNILSWVTDSDIKLIKIASEYMQSLNPAIGHTRNKRIRCEFFQHIVAHLFEYQDNFDVTKIDTFDDDIPF